MMKLYLLLMCLTGLVPVALSVAHCYHLITTPMTWSDAQTYCRQTYVDLAVMDSYQDWLRIAAEAARKLMILPAWIGLFNDLDSWRWTYNNLPLQNTTVVNWAWNEPTGGNDACSTISSSGVWSDCSCSSLNPYVCYDSSGSGSGRFFNYLFPPLTWDLARTFCKTIHTDLASATNSADNSDIQSKVSWLFPSWFGLFRDTWTWLGGTVASNLPWFLFQPNNLFGNENCATYTVGMLSDERCSSQFAFFCHSTPPVRMRQIIKLQVRADKSVLSSNVQLNILEQLKQVLDGKGMNITMGWKPQNDGNIFSKETKRCV